MDNQEMEQRKTDPWWQLIVLIVVVLALWLTCGLVTAYLLDNWSNRGNFGDMFGSISALFSGLAFAGLIYAIHLQKNELRLQREELELTRKELTRAALAQEASEKALKEQANSLLLTAKLNSLNTLLQVSNSKTDMIRERSGGLLEKEWLDHYKKLTFYSNELEKALASVEESMQDSK